jgi:hypothetical protein
MLNKNFQNDIVGLHLDLGAKLDVDGMHKIKLRPGSRHIELCRRPQKSWSPSHYFRCATCPSVDGATLFITRDRILDRYKIFF